MNEYNLRQLELMKLKIQCFEKKTLPLQVLISDLSDLVNVLEDFDVEWKNIIKHYWFDLEQVYAYLLYILEKQGYQSSQEIEIDEEGQKIINNSIHQIKKLVDEKILELEKK